MKEPYIEGLAPHGDPESCGGVRKDVREALTGARAGRVLSLETARNGSADIIQVSGRQHVGARYASASTTPRGHRPLACAETPGARTGRSEEHPGTMDPGSRGERRGGTPPMYVPRKSDWAVVPAKPRNNGCLQPADGVEERARTERNMPKRNTLRTQSRRSP